MSDEVFGAMELGDDRAIDGDIHRIEEPVRLGRYRLCYELGAGGMATVYLARAEGPGGFAKPVAIKRIHPHLARKRSLVEMFLDEARIASMCSHPNVCATFDFGESNGAYFLAMEYLVGEPLSVVLHRVARDRQAIGSARWHRVFAKIVADAAEGLHAAHELKDERGQHVGVIHRDVSPQNLFVTYDGVTKVMDFGVAFATNRIARTATGGIKGKVGYFAPEQIGGRAYDRRVDIWALGIVLWEGLTGRRLFQSRSELDTVLSVQQRDVPPPSSLVPQIPPELDAIAMRALQRDPALRFPTGRAMSRALVEYLRVAGAAGDHLEVGDFVQQICADRREARQEVVASVMEDPATKQPRPRTETAAPPALAAQASVADAATVSLMRRGALEPTPVPSVHERGALGTDAALHGGVARMSVAVLVAVAAIAVVMLLSRGNASSTETAPMRGARGGGALGTPGVATSGGAFGALVVTSASPVEVCIAGDCRWTPIAAEDLPAGRLALHFRDRDGAAWADTVDIASGRTLRLKVNRPD